MFTRIKNGYDNGPSELVRIEIDGTKEKVIISAADSDIVKVHSHDDHRLAMALTIAALSASGETVIEGVESAQISYPSFFDDMLALGVEINIK